MKHHVQTNTGESTKCYQHSEEYMKGGEGQGKISSPPNWLFQSSMLLNSLEKQCTSLYLTSVDKKYVSECVAEGYVDDTNAVTADQCTHATDTSAIITHRMETIVQIWADVIHGSRGKDGKATLATTEEVDAQITLTNGHSL
eukprot:2288515-Ditylum_brightwellii.AAC.1